MIHMDKKPSKKKKWKKRIGIVGGAVVTVILMILLLDRLISSALYTQKDPMMKQIKASSQYQNGKFRNPDPWQSKLGEMLSTLGEFIFSDTPRKPGKALPGRRAEIEAFLDLSENEVGSIWLGHSSILLHQNGTRILMDPVLENRISLMGPSRYNGALPITAAELPDLDLVLISHNHYDHLNRRTILSLSKRTAFFVCPLGIGAQLKKWGIKNEKIIELDWWQSHRFKDRLTVVATPAQHFSGRGLSDRDKTLWASWVVEGPSQRIFFSGDSGYFDGFRQIGERYGPFDICFMECGAYNERWHHIHMYPEETVQGHLDLRGKILHPIHWGTFNLSLHAWYEPMLRVSKAARSHGVLLATPEAGSLYRPGQPTPAWWEAHLPGKKQ